MVRPLVVLGVSNRAPRRCARSGSRGGVVPQTGRKPADCFGIDAGGGVRYVVGAEEIADGSRVGATSSLVEGVALITMNRPEKKNALSVALRDRISDAFDDLADDEKIRVVVLTGAGTVFSAGFDLSEFTTSDQRTQQAVWPSSDRFHHTLLRFPLPVVAAVNGPRWQVDSP